MAFNHLPAGVHDALAPLSVTPVTHSVPMAKNHRSDRSPADTVQRPSPGTVLDRLASGPSRASRITHTEHLPPRAGRHAVWPDRIHSEVIAAVHAAGIEHPWAHQALAAEHALDGDSVVVATGTASGKSLAYLVPVLSTLLEGSKAPNGRGATALYLAPTKALAADQCRAVKELARPLGTAVRPAVYDGDTPFEEREWIRQYGNYVLTNPDMLHRGILPSHPRWASFLKALKYVVIDECHTYRGVFGSHVAQVLRRLRRLCARYGASPVFLLASATAAEPSVAARRLTGLPVVEVADDASPRGELVFALWEPPLTEMQGEKGAPVRRTATAETADLLTDLAVQGIRTVAFVRSRRGAELISVIAQERLGEVDRSLARRVAAYRGGYLPEERRALERALHSGELLGLAATTALELGVDVSGLDAVLIAGYPGTRASLWQQAGRAGRSGQGALAVLIARDDPLDTFLVHHPEALFDQPVESTVLDPDNPYVLAPHLCAAAAELPLTDDDLPLFGPATAELMPQLEAAGLLRRRTKAWHWTRRERAADLTDIRGEGGRPIQIVEAGTGRLLGTVDAGSAHTTVHEGAVHLHQGRTYLVRSLDLEDSVALVEEAAPPYSTVARDTTAISVLETDVEVPWGDGRLCYGSVEVTNQVVSFLRRRLITGEVLGETKLDLLPGRCAPARCGGRSPRTSWTRPASTPRSSAAPCTPPNTPRSACCRSSRPATAGTSAACPSPCTPTRCSRPSSSTTATPAARASRSAPSTPPAPGSRPPVRPSPPASATPAARPASSPPSAATATIPCTSGARYGCSRNCCGGRRRKRGWRARRRRNRGLSGLGRREVRPDPRWCRESAQGCG